MDDISSLVSVVNINTMAPELNFHFHPVSEDQVSDILSNLTIRKSNGPDGIPSELLKIATPTTTVPLTKPFNLIILLASASGPINGNVVTLLLFVRKMTRHPNQIIVLLVSYQ